MMSVTPAETQSFLYGIVEKIVKAAKDSNSKLPGSTVNLVRFWALEYCRVFGLEEGSRMDPILQEIKAVDNAKDYLVKFYQAIIDHKV